MDICLKNNSFRVIYRIEGGWYCQLMGQYKLPNSPGSRHPTVVKFNCTFVIIYGHIGTTLKITVLELFTL